MLAREAACAGEVDVTEPDLTQLRVIFNQRRHAAGMTFDELAAVSGLSRQTLLNVSSGRMNGDIRTWLLLSRAFGVPLDALLDPVWGPDVDERSARIA